MSNSVRNTLLVIIAACVFVCMILSFSYAALSNTINTESAKNVSVKGYDDGFINVNDVRTFNLTGEYAQPVSDSKAFASDEYDFVFSISNSYETPVALKLSIAFLNGNTDMIPYLKYIIYQDGNSMPIKSQLINTSTLHTFNVGTDLLKLGSSVNSGYYISDYSFPLRSGAMSTIHLKLWLSDDESLNLNNSLNENIQFAIVAEKDEDYVFSFAEDYVGHVDNFDFTGSGQQFIAPYEGYYQLEVWGAQGSNCGSQQGGYGGYSIGSVLLVESQSIYIYVGGHPIQDCSKDDISGGYNGGGNHRYDSRNSNGKGGGGGGATHIATVDGVLKNLSSNVSNILIVAGGGGSAGAEKSTYYAGGNAGGISGAKGGSSKAPGSGVTNYGQSVGGTQTAGGVFNATCSTLVQSTSGGFGYGGIGFVYGAAGGGGYYGGSGHGYCFYGGGAGGSGYIGNSLLTDKAMYCYSCTTSSAAATYTVSNTCVDAIASTNCSKQGDGYARITYLGPTTT